MKHYLGKFHRVLIRVYHTYEWSASKQSIVLEGRVVDNRNRTYVHHWITRWGYTYSVRPIW